MITPSRRTTNFSYAIRNIVQAAEVLERSGRFVTYLNIGDMTAPRVEASFTRVR